MVDAKGWPVGFMILKLLVQIPPTQFWDFSSCYLLFGVFQLNLIFGYYSKNEFCARADSKTLYVTMESGVVFLALETGEVSRRVDMNTTYWKQIVVHLD